MSDDLVAFLRARLDEDEIAATAYVPVSGLTHRHAEGDGWREHNHMAGSRRHQHDPDSGFQIKAPKPTIGNSARVLREVAAKRKLLELADESDEIERSLNDEVARRPVPGEVSIGDQIRRALVTVYSGHPDYRADWKP